MRGDRGLRPPRGRPAARIAVAVALLLEPNLAQQPAEVVDVDVERVRSEVLKRLGRWIDDTKDRLKEEAGNPQGVEAAMEALHSEIREIVRQEVRGPRIGRLAKEGSVAKSALPDAPFARPPGAIYAGRFADKNALRASGGGSETEEPLRRALEWLAIHQDVDGRWDADGFVKNCPPGACGRPGQPRNDVGVTGLALLALLGDGNRIES